MKFIEIKNNKIISWKLVNYDINNIISINTLPDILDNHFNWKEIINDYFSSKNKGNIPKKHSLHKIISNSLESKRKEIKNFPCVEKEVFKFLNKKDIRHTNYVELTEKELDYQMKLILFAFTIIDL